MGIDATNRRGRHYGGTAGGWGVTISGVRTQIIRGLSALAGGHAEGRRHCELVLIGARVERSRSLTNAMSNQDGASVAQRAMMVHGEDTAYRGTLTEHNGQSWIRADELGSMLTSIKQMAGLLEPEHMGSEVGG